MLEDGAPTIAEFGPGLDFDLDQLGLMLAL